MVKRWERKLLADGVWYRDREGGLHKENWTETLAHERIDNLFERIEALEHWSPESLTKASLNLNERVKAMESWVKDFPYSAYDFPSPPSPKPHTCGECMKPFYRSDYGLCRSHPVLEKGCQPIAIWREKEACDNFKGE